MEPLGHGAIRFRHLGDLKYGASVAKETYEPDEAYADWHGDYVPVRRAWPLSSDPDLAR